MGEPPWGWLCPRGTPQLTHSHQAPQQLIPWDMVLRRHPQTSPIRGVRGTKGSSLRCHIGPELTQQVHIIPRVHPLGHGQHRHPKSTSRGWMSTPGPCTGTPRPHPSGAWATLAPQELTQRVSGAAWAPTPPTPALPWPRVPTLPPVQHLPRGSAEPPSQPPAPAPRPSAAPAARPSPSPRWPAARRRRTGWRGCNSWCSAGSCRSRAQAGRAQRGGSRGGAVSYLQTVRTSRAEMRVSSDSEYPTV